MLALLLLSSTRLVAGTVTTDSGCTCLPATFDYTHDVERMWAGCGKEGWCDVEAGCDSECNHTYLSSDFNSTSREPTHGSACAATKFDHDTFYQVLKSPGTMITRAGTSAKAPTAPAAATII